jgi:hypothetical protein
MSDVCQPECFEIRDFQALTEDQQETLHTRGVVLVEFFLSMATTNPAAMAAVLSCSLQEIARFRAAAEESLRSPTIDDVMRGRDDHGSRVKGQRRRYSHSACSSGR